MQNCLISDLYALDSFDSKMQHLKSNIELIKDFKIESIINTFKCISTSDEAMELAVLFKMHYGNLIMCCSRSYRLKNFITIIDYLDDSKTFFLYKYVKLYKKLLLEAFSKLGYKHAKFYSVEELYEEYNKDKSDGEWIFNKYPDMKTRLVDEFFEGLSIDKPLNERIQILKNTSLRLQTLNQPEMIIDRFSDVKTMNQSLEISHVLYNKFRSHVIVCREASFRQGEFMTLIDVLESVNLTWKEKPYRGLFIKAFHKIRFQRANDSNTNKIKELYQACSEYCVTNGHLHSKGIMDFKEYGDESIYVLEERLRSCFDIPEFINELQTSNASFSQIIRPSCYFMNEEIMENGNEFTFDHAVTIAKIFKKRLGTTTISKMDSYHTGRYMTILDEIDMLLKLNSINQEALSLFLKAFEQLGFKRAKDCNPLVLRQLQTCDGKYNYQEMKSNHSWLLEEITMEIYRPKRIQKWLDNGHDLEDYMK